MGSTRSVRGSGEADLNRRVDGQLVQATSRHEVLSTLCTADYLEKDGDSGWNERGVVDEEVGAVEVEDHVDGLVYTTLHRATRLINQSRSATRANPSEEHIITYRGLRSKGMKIDFIQQVLRSLLGSCRFDRGSSIVAQDGRVDATLETDITERRVGADPVVVN